MNFQNETYKQHQNTHYSKHLYYLDNISVQFKNGLALTSIQLVISAGEMIFLTGASGAGKTTLLNVLAGIVKPKSGRIFGPSVKDKNQNSFISMVFQDLKLIEAWTCFDNLVLAYDSKIYESKDEFFEELAELSRIFNIKDHLSKKVCDANGGLKQKVAIIRALLSRPNIILADEPTSSLDKDNANRLYDVLCYYNTKRKVTIIWASHNKDLFKQFSGRIIHLEAGKLIYSGHACFI